MDIVDASVLYFLTHTPLSLFSTNNDFPLAYYICAMPRISPAKGCVDCRTLLGSQPEN